MAPNFVINVNIKSSQQITTELSSFRLGGGNVVYLSVVKSYNIATIQGYTW